MIHVAHCPLEEADYYEIEQNSFLSEHLELPFGINGQNVLDVLHHTRRGGGGEGEDGAPPLSPPNWGEVLSRNQLADLGDFEIRRTEIVAPLRNAVGFIDRDETDADAPQFDLENLGSESLGRNIKDFHAPENAVFERRDDFRM